MGGIFVKFKEQNHMEKEKYTVKDAAKLMGVPTSTIRYYDKEGLLPFMERMESGYRIFTEKDIATLRIEYSVTSEPLNPL